MQDTKRVKNPKKQRKRMFNAPAHIRHKFMSAPLSHELTASKGAKTLPVRKGDTILIKRGDNKGFEGKISRVDLKAFRIYIEGLTREKVDGTNIFLPIHQKRGEAQLMINGEKTLKKEGNRTTCKQKLSLQRK
jgi:large subunit ribosomal protein L24